MVLKDQFFNLVRYNLRDGFSFREDTWFGNQHISYRFPNFFNIVYKKYATIAEVFSTSPLNVSFRRTTIGNKLLECNNLIATMANVNLLSYEP